MGERAAPALERGDAFVAMTFAVIHKRDAGASVK
jgi:hypothetical protein